MDRTKKVHKVGSKRKGDRSVKKKAKRSSKRTDANIYSVPQLPVEIIFKIWSYLDVIPLPLRAVCRMWKRWWESIEKRKKVLERLKIRCDGDQYVLERRLELPEKKASKELMIPRSKNGYLLQVLSLIQLGEEPRDVEQSGGALTICDGAVNEDIFKAVSSQKWNINRLTLAGDLSAVEADALCCFTEKLNQGTSELRSIHFKDVNIPDDLICDKLVEAMHNKFAEFVVRQSRQSVGSHPKIPLSEGALRRLFVPGMKLTLPECYQITVENLRNCIKDYFTSNWNEKPFGHLEHASFVTKLSTMFFELHNWNRMSFKELRDMCSNFAEENDVGFFQSSWFRDSVEMGRILLTADRDDLSLDLIITVHYVDDKNYDLIMNEGCHSESDFDTEDEDDSEFSEYDSVTSSSSSEGWHPRRNRARR